MPNNSRQIEDSLDELLQVHETYGTEIVGKYPSDHEIESLVRLFLAIIYHATDRNNLRSRVITFHTMLKKAIRKCREGNLNANDKEIDCIINIVLKEMPEIAKKSHQDIDFALNEDPAVFGREEIIKCYPFARAVPVYRLANIIHRSEVQILPRMLTEYMHSRTGIDIHPSACIDSPFFIDHGTGVVIGGTATIGKNVKIFHGVTLGAKAFDRNSDGVVIKGKKRHPTIKDNVSIYSGAVILGGDTVIETNSVVGGNALITHGVPKNTMVLISEESLSYIRI